MSRYSSFFLLVSLFAHAAFAADDPPAPPAAEPGTEEVQAVVVPGVKNPELRNYRSMLAGLDEFEERHQFAPKADTLRFELYSKRAGETVAGLSLRIAGGDVSIPVPIAANGTFVLPRNKEAEDSDADLILNRPKRSWSGRPYIRSAGVPDNMRRLGDVRLECRVAVAIGKKEINFLLRAAATTILATSDWCSSKRISYGVPAPYPSDSITLVHGERRQVMPAGKYKKSFTIPIQDEAWPDDTLIEFNAASPPTAASFSSEPIYVRGTMNKWAAVVPMQQVDATTYRVDVMLAKGVNRFKIATKDYRMVDLGAADAKANETKGNFNVGDRRALAWSDDNIWFEPPQPGMYVFTLNVADPMTPTITITAKQ